MRVTEFAPAIPPQSEPAATHPASAAASAPASGYGPPATAARLGKLAASLAQTFLSNPMGRSGVQQGSSFTPTSGEKRVDGSLRVVYAASIRSCRPCPLRKPRQRQGSATKKPRQVSVLLHPLAIGSAPVLWRDWSRRHHRRACLQLHSRRLEIQMEQARSMSSDASPPSFSRAQRAHDRLKFQERLARNARAPGAGPVAIKLFGIPEDFATSLGLPTT